MGFAGILFGLPLAALPVIVHLMARRRKKVVHWGAMQFLVAAKQRARRSWRLREILLLLLRVLGLTALIFAIAQPEIPVSWLGGHEPRDIIVIVDESMSTSALDGTKSLYELQQEELERLFSEKDVDGTDHLRVLVAGAKLEWLAEVAVKGDGSSQKAILGSLSKRSPSLAAADLPAAIEAALAAPEAQAGLARHVFVVTDGQAYRWNPDMTGRWGALNDKLKEFPAGSEIRIRPAASETMDIANLVVQKVELAREVVAAMEPVTFRATVTNYSESDSGTAILHWLVDGEEVGAVTVPSIEPNSDSTVGIEHSFSEPGLFQISCKMDGSDVLSADDEAFAMIEVAAGIPVLIVEGSPSDDPLKTDSAYLLAALGDFQDQDEGVNVASPFKATLIDATALATTELAPFRVVVLTNAPPLGSPVMEKLKTFVQAGGGLWVSLGDQMQPEWFNRTFVAGGGGLAPLEIGNAIGDAEGREKYDLVSPPTQPHPATIVLADTDKLDIDRARVYRRFPYFGAVPRDVSILLQFDDGSPLAVESHVGEGRVIVQAVPLGASWSNLPLLVSYVAMVHEWLWYLVEPGMIARNLNPGEPIAFEVDDSISGGEITVQDPSGNETPLGNITLGSERLVSFNETLNPGLYHVGMRSGDDWENLSSFNVARAPEESNLARLEEEELGKLRSAGLVFGSEATRKEANEEAATRVTRKPIWEWLLIGVIAFLIGESILALWISKGRQPVSAGASMQ